MSEALGRHKKKRFNPHDDAESQPEFQVAPMVDVLLVLLLFFMATATTEVVVQRADLELPKADDSKDPGERQGQFVINIEKLNFKINAEGRYFDNADELIPLIQAARETDAQQRGSDGTAFRVLIRADKEASYSLIREIMKACAEAGVGNVTFAVTKGGEDGANGSTGGGA
ncbi:MAG: biopolymer transporter ExbD [Verrucomicrobiia bacterium]